MTRACHAAAIAAAAAAVLAVGGCTDPDVVAAVGKGKVLRAELDGSVGGRGRPADPAKALDPIIERALLAEGARAAGLANDPAVRARLAAAEREILAQAFVDREVGPAASEDALLKRYRERPDALARRRIHVAHLAARAPPGDAARRAEALSRVNRAYMRLLAGERFEVLAKEVSDDEVSAPRGGDLGPLLEGEVDAAFFEAAASLRRGETSKPFESSLGFHLAKALEEPSTVTPTFAEARSTLAAAAQREALALALERLRGDVSVKRYPDRLPAPKAASAQRADQR